LVLVVEEFFSVVEVEFPYDGVFVATAGDEQRSAALGFADG
jgi:hypothetical protein